MEETKKSLEDLEALKDDTQTSEEVEIEVTKPKIDELGRSYATGKRKIRTTQK